MKEEILVVKKDKGKDKISFKIANRGVDGFTYLKVIPNKDYNQLAILLYDLYIKGYNVEKAFSKFKEFLNEPDPFFS